MRNINKALKSTILLVLSLTLLLTLSSCGWLNAFISQLKGELIGNDYIITEYDNFGNPVLQVKGDKITMDGAVDSAGEPTSYITITVDGYEWDHSKWHQYGHRLRSAGSYRNSRRHQYWTDGCRPGDKPLQEPVWQEVRSHRFVSEWHSYWGIPG